jgi:hypothetical protein
LSRIDELNKKINELRDEIRRESADIFTQEIAEDLKNSLPEGAVGLLWRQFTPTFNDGEPCEFTVSDVDEFLFETEQEKSENWYDGYEEVEVNGKSYFAITPEWEFSKKIETYKILSSIPYEVYEQAFGDDKTIFFVVENGEGKFFTEEYYDG